jgi:hypothetical protein
MAHFPRPVTHDLDGRQIARLRAVCLALPGANEKLAWGTPCFYAGKKLFAMFEDHQQLDRLAVWLKAAPGVQEMLLESSPGLCFKPPYVGPYGWIGLHLKRIDDDTLAHHVREAWKLSATKTLLKQLDAAPEPVAAKKSRGRKLS